MKIFRWMAAVPKTIYINFKVFRFKTAIKFPIICSHIVRIKGISKGSIEIQNKIRKGMIRLGMSDGSFGNGCNGISNLNISKGGRIVFTGEANIANYFSINIGSNGIVKFGSNYYSNFGLLISCSKSIEFGNDTIVGWNCCFIDGDGHKIFNDVAEETNVSSSIFIGNHVWIASNVNVLKGSLIIDDCVVAQSALVTKKFNEPNCLIGGVPAKIIKRNITWEK